MNIELELIESLDAIDFDYMFSESFSRLELNFIWPVNVTTYEQKKEYFLNRLQSAIDGDWKLKNDDDTFLMMITKADGVIVEFSAGYLEADGGLSLHWNLTAPVPGGNRNWRYSPEAQQARKDFAVSIGATSFKEHTYVGSLLYRTLKSRATAGNYTIEEEIPPQPSFFPQKLVVLTIRFN